jgi:hypothetical protein
MDVRIRGYFSKPKGVREQKRLRNTAIDYICVCSRIMIKLGTLKYKIRRK